MHRVCADTRLWSIRVKADAGEGGNGLRTVVRALDVRVARRAQDLLAAAGCEAVARVGAESGSQICDDILIVAGDGLDQCTRLARAREPTSRPVAVLYATTSASPPPPGLEPVAPFDGALALDAPPLLLSRQIAHALRAGVAVEERARRRETALALGHALPVSHEPRGVKALYIGAPSPFFLSLERALGAHGGAVTAAFTSFTGFDHLHDEAFDAVALNGAADPQTAVALCAALRRNASLSNLPTLMVTAPRDANTARQAIERGAAAVTAGDEDSAPALGWLFDAIRRERLRRTAEQDILALRDVMGDPRTGLFVAKAFQAHLARLADDHHATGRPFSLVCLRVLPAHGASRPSEPVWKKGFTEIASLACRLVRESDCGASFEGEFIALALPFTDYKGARRVSERVASVAECTAFASGENGAPPLIFEQSVVELQPGESGGALLARARTAFDIESGVA